MKKWWKMPTKGSHPVAQYLFLVVVLFCFWFFLSGSLEPRMLFYGIATSFIAAWVCMPLLMVPASSDGKERYYMFDFSIPRLIAYIPWILKELIKANLDVIRAEMSPELKIDPRVVRFKYNVKNPVAKSFLANSITLTPGTVTLHVNDESVFEVHALTKGAAEGLLSGDMQRRVARIFREEGSIVVLSDRQEDSEWT